MSAASSDIARAAEALSSATALFLTAGAGIFDGGAQTSTSTKRRDSDVRMTSEHVAAITGGTLVRINVREPEVNSTRAPCASLAMGALDALAAIDAELADRRRRHLN